MSYYDYYQPEAYVVSSDTYIQKDALINDRIDKLRHSATRALLERNDVIIVSSVSCIYGLGERSAYDGMLLQLEIGQIIERKQILRRLVEILYDRNDADFTVERFVRVAMSSRFFQLMRIRMPFESNCSVMKSNVFR